MTTENVTVMFTDMVDSTARASALRPDAADELRRQHYAILRQAVADTGGTEVKNLGDGLMLVFGAPSAAMSCAVAMQQAIERDNRRRELHVGLRVGLSGGEVVHEDRDYFGEPVIEAARLCARCDGGQILAADIVRLTAGRRSHHECRPIGRLALKGLPAPVDAVEICWAPLDPADTDTAVPLPARLAIRPVSVIGRDTDLAMIGDAFKRIARDEGRELLLVSGEAGIGKSTLVAAAARTAFADGACVLLGHCEENLAIPYQLFVEALGHYVTHAKQEQLVRDVGSDGMPLNRLVPALSSRLPPLGPATATDADTERYQMFAAVVGLLRRVSQRQPVVLVVDDLQWSDTASLQLLRHVIAADQPMRLLVLGTYRDGELSHTHPLTETLAALHREPRVTHVELRGLDDSGVVALVEAAAGHDLDEGAVRLAHALHSETDGNPFFVTEVLRHLAQTGAIVQDLTGRWSADADLDGMLLPDGVRVTIGARVGRLGRRAEQVLSLAAVLGRDFDLEVLSLAIVDTSDAELLDVLDAAKAVALVRELPDPGHYSFTHALIQHTLYDELGSTRRARAHRQVAVALEDLCGGRPGARIGELARHWSLAAEPVDLAKALDYSRRAADAALSALAPADALHYYAQAIRLQTRSENPDPILGVDLAIGLGAAQRQTGDPGYRRTLLDAAHRADELDDTDRLVAAALANNRGAMVSSVGTIDADKVEILELALDRLPADDLNRALVLATLCAELAFGSPFERRLALADEAFAIASAAEDDATIVRVFMNAGPPIAVPSRLEQLAAQSADVLRRAQRIGDPVLLFWAAVCCVQGAAKCGDIEEMDRCHALVGSIAERLDQPTLRWIHRYHGALRALIAGDVLQAEEMATDALRLGTAGGQADAAIIYGGQLAAICVLRGTADDFVPVIEQYAAEGSETAFVATYAAGMALIYSHAGRVDDARRMLEEFAASGYQLPLDANWLPGMANYAEAAVACGDRRSAAALFERLAPWADQLPVPGNTASAPVSHLLGGLATVLHRFDEADARFAQAAAFSDRVGAAYFAACTNLWWGRMLGERDTPGDAERAHDLLSLAHTAAAAYGYGAVERQAAEALKRLGGPTP